MEEKERERERDREGGRERGRERERETVETWKWTVSLKRLNHSGQMLTPANTTCVNYGSHKNNGSSLPLKLKNVLSLYLHLEWFHVNACIYVIVSVLLAE